MEHDRRHGLNAREANEYRLQRVAYMDVNRIDQLPNMDDDGGQSETDEGIEDDFAGTETVCRTKTISARQVRDSLWTSIVYCITSSYVKIKKQ